YDRALLRAFQHATRAEHGGLDIRTVRQHRDSDTRPGRHIGGRFAPRGASRGDLIHRSADHVVNNELMTCLEQVLGHRPSHDSKTNESDIRQLSLLYTSKRL